MTISLADLQTRKATVDVFGDGTFNVTYRMDAITTEVLLGTQMPKKKDEAAMAEWFSRNVDTVADLIESWDLVDNDNEPLPITREVLRSRLPFGVVMQIFTAIMNDFQVGNTKGRQS